MTVCFRLHLPSYVSALFCCFKNTRNYCIFKHYLTFFLPNYLQKISHVSGSHSPGPASSAFVYFCIYIGASWCVYIFAFHDQHCLCYSGICIRSSTGVVNPKYLHFSNLTEALQPKLSMHLIQVFANYKPQEAERSAGPSFPAPCNKMAPKPVVFVLYNSVTNVSMLTRIAGFGR